jgi:hypothetical protein
VAAYRDLIEDAAACGARAAAAHLRAAEGEVFTFLTHPAAGRLLFGDKGRRGTKSLPQLAAPAVKAVGDAYLTCPFAEEQVRARETMMALPETDLARVRRWVDARNEAMPSEALDQVQIEMGAGPRAITILECRPPWDEPANPQWIRHEIARLQYTASRRE